MHDKKEKKTTLFFVKNVYQAFKVENFLGKFMYMHSRHLGL